MSNPTWRPHTAGRSAARWSFDIFRRRARSPFPRSLSTALRAYRHGQVGIEPAIYRAGSVGSVYRRPLNIALVRELLAKSGLDIRVNRVVAQQLFENLQHEEHEISEFAAQTLARLEERYYQELRTLEGAMEAALERARHADGAAQGDPDREAASPASDLVSLRDQLSRRYLDFASLQSFNRTLERYYLRKTAELLSPIEQQPPDLAVRHLKALIRLGETEAAARTLRSATSLSGARKADRIIAEAELAYQTRDFRVVQEAMRQLKVLEEDGTILIAEGGRRRAIWEPWL